jgi:hypothetical protein
VKKHTSERSVRFLWGDGTPFEIHFWVKGRSKSQAQIQHRGFATKAATERQREFSSERLDALARSLATE